ncbi:WRKY transcription factor 70 [Spatholobus suberectus]|nr:WRKY transcription factor 70 [Spatholobus suberectus]
MENQPSNGRKAMEEELVKGRDITNHLLEILVPKCNTHHGGVQVEGLVLPFAEDLVRKVLRSFTNTLLLLNTDMDVSDEVVMPTTIKDVSSSVKCPKPEDKDYNNFLNAKRRRGCHKSSSPTWENNSSILTEDGYVWRKYGQKMTMNAKYLRSYYRCTHKYDEGCPAIKQVQRIQEDPPLYRTTYYGHHNCKSSSSPEIMIMEPPSSSGSSKVLSFSNTFPSKEEYPFSSSLSSSTKQEPMEVIPEGQSSDHNQLPSSNYLLLCDYELDFNYSRQVTMLSSIDQSIKFDTVYGSGLDFDG